MKKSTFTPLYEAFRVRLVEMRKTAKLTQRQLAEKLGAVRTIVERIEMGERRVDVVELYWLCKVFKVDPKEAFVEVVKVLQFADKQERSKLSSSRKQGRSVRRPRD